MCGIAGFISNNPKYNKKDIVRNMLKILSHRGPDGEGIVEVDEIALGMNRLAIIDNIPHQMPFSKDNFYIAYNGEIFNYDAIKGDYKTNSDIERVLNHYIQKKEKALNDFNGMFAFSIYDKNNKELFLARDRVGKSPLYYAKGKDYFIFASEIKALLTFIEPKLNHEKSYEIFEFSTFRETLFKDIYQLQAGEYLVYKDSKLKIKSYYKLWENRINLPDDENRLIIRLTELIEDAVLIRTKNRVHNFTTLLSGGIDSSLITAIAKPDVIYTAHYEFSDFDELDYAKLLAKSINRDLKIITPTKEDFLRYNSEIIHYMDTPPTWTSFTLYMLLKEIKKDGFKIVLSGEGADEAFGGYYRYLLIYHDELIKKVPQMKNYQFLINRYYGSIVDRYAKLINRGGDEDYLKSFLYEIYQNSKDEIDFMGLVDFYTTMQILLQMADRLSFANQIENRSPFLDHRVLEFGFSLDKKYKINDYTTKYLLRKVASKFIPKEIVERVDKRGFSAPINRWFSQDGYDRNFYKKLVFKEWKRVFNV